MFNFLSVWQREEVVKANELERDVFGLIQKDSRKKKIRERSQIIGQYSKLLQDGKISVGRFLITMANIDNKIVFDEQEYPTLDLDEIEFEYTEDLDKMRELLKQSVHKDADPIIYSTSTKSNENIATECNKLNEPKTKSKQIAPPVLTRSKARKLASNKNINSKEQQETATNLANGTVEQITIPEMLTRSKAKNTPKEINRANQAVNSTSASKRYYVLFNFIFICIQSIHFFLC